MKRRQSFTSNCNSLIKNNLNRFHSLQKESTNRIHGIFTSLIVLFLLITQQSMGIESNVVFSSTPTAAVNATNVVSNVVAVDTATVNFPPPVKIPDNVFFPPPDDNTECTTEGEIELTLIKDESITIEEGSGEVPESIDLVFELSIPKPQFETVETPEGSFQRFCPGIFDGGYTPNGDESIFQPEIPLYSFPVAIPLFSQIAKITVSPIDSGTIWNDIRLYPIQPKIFSNSSFLSQLNGNLSKGTFISKTSLSQRTMNPSSVKLKQPFIFNKTKYLEATSIYDQYKPQVFQRFRNNIQKVSLNIFDYNPQELRLISYDKLEVTITINLDRNIKLGYRGRSELNKNLTPVEESFRQSLPNFSTYKEPRFTIPITIFAAHNSDLFKVRVPPPDTPEDDLDHRINIDQYSLGTLWKELRVYDEEGYPLQGIEQIADFFNLKKYPEDTDFQGIELKLDRDFGIKTAKKSFLFYNPVFKSLQGLELNEGLTLGDALKVTFEHNEMTKYIDTPLVFNVAVNEGGAGEFFFPSQGFEFNYQSLSNIYSELFLLDSPAHKNSIKPSAVKPSSSSIISKNVVTSDIPADKSDTCNITSSSDWPELLVIYDDSLSGAAGHLNDHKNKNNVSTEIVSTEEIKQACYGCRGEEDPSCELTDVLIKQYIKSYEVEYDSLGYVLLLGDSELIPSHTQEIHIDDNTIEVAADIYYGQFDTEHDPTNPNNPEMHEIIPQLPGILVGRLPCSDENEALAVVNKIINYETTHSDSATDSDLKTFRETFNFATGLSPTPMLQEEQADLSDTGITPENLAEITPENLYKGTVICHLGDASREGWYAPLFPNTNFPTLPQHTKDEELAMEPQRSQVVDEPPQVGHYPFVLSISSESVWFQDEDCSLSCPISWSISLLNGKNSGAIGVVGPSISLSDTDYDKFTRGIFNYIIAGNAYTQQGIMHYQGLDNLILQQEPPEGEEEPEDPNQMQTLLRAFNLLGDPSLKIGVN